MKRAHHQMLTGTEIATNILGTGRISNSPGNGWSKIKSRTYEETGRVAWQSVNVLAHPRRRKSPMDDAAATRLNRKGSSRKTKYLTKSLGGSLANSWGENQRVPHK